MALLSYLNRRDVGIKRRESTTWCEKKKAVIEERVQVYTRMAEGRRRCSFIGGGKHDGGKKEGVHGCEAKRSSAYLCQRRNLILVEEKTLTTACKKAKERKQSPEEVSRAEKWKENGASFGLIAQIVAWAMGGHKLELSDTTILSMSEKKYEKKRRRSPL